MEQKHPEAIIENERLEETILLAKKQLKLAQQANEKNHASILSSKQELRENTSHSVSNLWSSEGFEALAELSQYTNTITTQVANYEVIENKIRQLEKLIKSPYFARIDFKFQGEEPYEKIYIGRSSLMEEDTYDIFVHDWRSPIASVFYRFVKGAAYYDAPNSRIFGDINLKRQFEINNGILEFFFDADVQIIDEFLRKLLSQNTSPGMKAIVETIQKEQDIVIRDMENDLMMVQGVAGSGKTSIALHRSAYLMYQGLSSKLSANNIMIISPNALFEQYISNVLPELGEENVVTAIPEALFSVILDRENIQSRNRFLENLITSPSYHSIIKSSIEFKTSNAFVSILNRFILDLPNRWIDFKSIYYDGVCIASKETLKEKVLSGRTNSSLGMKLELMEDFVLEALLEARNNSKNRPDITPVKNELQQLTQLNIDALYRHLFQDISYFNSLAKGIPLPKNMEEIFAFTRENLNTSYLYYDDAIAQTYLKLKIYGSSDYGSIKQVVIDEAQDYYPMHFEIFNLLFPRAKFTVLGDINQTLEKQEDLSLYTQISSILNKKRSILITMDKSFRCTNEILSYSSKFIDHTIEIESFNRTGEPPGVFITEKQMEFNKLIVEEINRCKGAGYQSIGLICKTERNAVNLYQQLKHHVSAKLIKGGGTADLRGISILPVYMSKGLEFDAVLICDANAKTYKSEDDKKLLYIACTRALHRLNLFSKGKVSPLL